MKITPMIIENNITDKIEIQNPIVWVLWESPEEEGNWGYGAGFARPIPPYLSIHHGNSQRAIV